MTLVSTQKIQKGIVSYIENEIAAKADGLRKFAIYFFIPSIDKTVANYLSKLKDFMPDVFDATTSDSQPQIKLNVLYENAKAAIRKSGRFEYMNIIFDESDVDKLYNYIKEALV
jgi:hypothetical protein